MFTTFTHKLKTMKYNKNTDLEKEIEIFLEKHDEFLKKEKVFNTSCDWGKIHKTGLIYRNSSKNRDVIIHTEESVWGVSQRYIKDMVSYYDFLKNKEGHRFDIVFVLKYKLTNDSDKYLFGEAPYVIYETDGIEEVKKTILNL